MILLILLLVHHLFVALGVVFEFCTIYNGGIRLD